MKKIVALFDAHYPYNINLKPVLEFIKDFKPDRTVFGGDTLDLAFLSHWNELSPGKWIAHDVQEDFDAVGKIIDKVKESCPQIDYLIGNHEHWLTQFTDKFPYLRGSLDLKRGLKTEERGINLVPLNKSLKIGHLHFLHGIYCNDQHAKKTVLAYQRCVRYGHTHDYQVYSIISPMDTHKVYNAMSCGCLCNRNAEFMHGKPNKWLHGFYVAYIQDNGDFTDYFVPIIRNKFAWAGKIYE
jgi:predicted phosphodiesterase